VNVEKMGDTVIGELTKLSDASLKKILHERPVTQRTE